MTNSPPGLPGQEQEKSEIVKESGVETQRFEEQRRTEYDSTANKILR